MAVTTDDLLFATQHKSCLDKLMTKLTKYCSITIQKGQELSYLNLRIIQSEHGISIDQAQHIERTIIEPYWNHVTDKKKIYFCESPFPIDSSFEKQLFDSFPLDSDGLQEFENKHHGSLPHWVGALMHICVWTRFDIHYAVTRLSGYMACPKSLCFHILHLLLEYLYHHPHYPIFYKRGQSSTSPCLQGSCSNGYAEILHYNRQIILNGYVDADQSRDLQDRRSIASALWMINNSLVSWICKKHVSTALYSNHAEMLSLLFAIKKTLEIQHLLLQL